MPDTHLAWLAGLLGYAALLTLLMCALTRTSDRYDNDRSNQ